MTYILLLLNAVEIYLLVRILRVRKKDLEDLL